MDWLNVLMQSIQIAISVGGVIFRWMMTLPKELYIVGSALAIIYIAYEYKEYEITGSVTGSVLTVLAIIFILIALFIFLR